jgi:hypothetical protein
MPRSPQRSTIQIVYVLLFRKREHNTKGYQSHFEKAKFELFYKNALGMKEMALDETLICNLGT